MLIAKRDHQINWTARDTDISHDSRQELLPFAEPCQEHEPESGYCLHFIPGG